MPKGGAKNTMEEYEQVPMGNGQLRHIPSGKFIHESKLLGVLPAPQPPTCRCNPFDSFAFGASMPLLWNHATRDRRAKSYDRLNHQPKP